ncbi:hypothetical protein FHH43_15800 [Clostridium perfringens]|nr:hypothetical protein [Clostridium perfringens]
MKKPLVIAVAAVSGGGKTTIINDLVKNLPFSKAVYFDEYDFDEYPENFYKWIQNGSDFNDWNIDVLVKDVKNLLNQSDFHYILLDYPFAYKNKQLSPYIDCAIFIDTPLDIAMARRILRDMINEPKELLANDLNHYLSYGRFAYLEMIKQIKPNSDLIIDGTLSANHIADQIIKQISKINDLK